MSDRAPEGRQQRNLPILPLQTNSNASFNGIFLYELLNETLFSSLAETRENIIEWKGSETRHRPTLFLLELHAAGIRIDHAT